MIVTHIRWLQTEEIKLLVLSYVIKTLENLKNVHQENNNTKTYDNGNAMVERYLSKPFKKETG